jgi:hypothetical protein
VADAPKPKRRPKYVRRPSVQPKLAADLMPEVFRWLNLDDGARSFAAQRAFCRCAGAAIVARARPERLRGPTLWVRVSSAAWSHQLHAVSAELLVKLRNTPGGEGIEHLRFIVGPVDELPTWETAPPAQARLRPPGAPPGPAVLEAIEDVTDPELRQAILDMLNKI